MKRIGVSMLLLFTLSLSACAVKPAERHSYLQVKCPSCGYEFQTPAK